MTTSTYAPPFLQNPGVQQQAAPWQQQGLYGPPGQFFPSGIEHLQPYGGQQFGTGGVGQVPGVEQIIPSIQVVVQLLGNAQQCVWTAQHVMAQLPGYLATAVQTHQLQGQQRQFQRPFPMAW